MLGSRLIDLAQPFLDCRCNIPGHHATVRSRLVAPLMQGGSWSRCDSAQGSTWLVLNALVTPASALAVGGFGEARGWRSRSSSGMAFRGRLTIFLTREICGHEFRAGPMDMFRPWWISRSQSPHFVFFQRGPQNGISITMCEYMGLKPMNNRAQMSPSVPRSRIILVHQKPS